MSQPEREWTIIFERSAEKELRRLPSPLIQRIDRAIQDLRHDPRPHGSVKLKGHENLYRVRVGSWRIIYAIEEDELIIVVVEIAPRGGAYRNL